MVVDWLHTADERFGCSFDNLTTLKWVASPLRGASPLEQRVCLMHHSIALAPSAEVIHAVRPVAEISQPLPSHLISARRDWTMLDAWLMQELVDAAGRGLRSSRMFRITSRVDV
jgi:hypothetical protein